MKHSREFECNKGRFKTLHADELREIASKGGKATAKKNRNRKKLGELADIMLSSELSGKNKQKILEMFPELEDEDVTYAALVVFAQIMAAVGEKKVNAKSFEMLMELQNNSSVQEEKDPLSQALEEAAKKL